MTSSSLAGERLSINDIKAFSDIISAGFKHHIKHNGPFKEEYLKKIVIMGGLSFFNSSDKKWFLKSDGKASDRVFI